MAADGVLAQARTDFNSVTPANTNTTATWGGSLGIPDTYGRTVSLTGCGYWNYYQTTSSTEPLQNLARLSWQQNSVWLAGTHGFAGTGDNNMHTVALTYDAAPATAGVQDGAGTGWDGSTANWWNGSSDVVWPDTTAYEAIIGAGSGPAGTIAVTGTRTLNKLTFNSPGSGSYMLSGGTLNFGGTTPTITGSAGTTISSILAGTAGLTKIGAGNLTLSALKTFSGDFSISQGTVTANAGSDVLNRSNGPLGNPQANASKIVVATGATLAFTAHDSLGNAPSLPQVFVEANGGTVTTDGHLVTSSPWVRSRSTAVFLPPPPVSPPATATS